MSPPDSDGLLPLDGLRIVELSSFVAAPFAGMTLRQLGAEVVRIDRPQGNADIRRWPMAQGGASMYWAGLNKGKKSVCIDWQTTEGSHIVADMVAESGPTGGVLLTNHLLKGPLTYDTLATTRDDLVYVLITGTHDGDVAVDYTVNASVGFPIVTGGSDSTRPINSVVPTWDLACGLFAAISLLAAERQRARDSRSQLIRVALQDVALASTGSLGVFAEAEIGRVNREPIGNSIYGTFGRDFTADDGEHFMVVALTERHWSELLETTELTRIVEAIEGHLGADFTLEGHRFVHRGVLGELLQDWFEQRSSGEVEAILSSTSVPWSRYRTFADWVTGPEPLASANPVFERLMQPGIGDHWSVGSPIVRDGVYIPPEVSPTLGDHTGSVLNSWLGLTTDELADLSERGIIGGPGLGGE